MDERFSFGLFTWSNWDNDGMMPAWGLVPIIIVVREIVVRRVVPVRRIWRVVPVRHIWRVIPYRNTWRHAAAVSKVGEVAIISHGIPVLSDWTLIFESHAVVTFVETFAV